MSDTNTFYKFFCSHCGNEWDDQYPESECPNCGAENAIWTVAYEQQAKAVADLLEALDRGPGKGLVNHDAINILDRNIDLNLIAVALDTIPKLVEMLEDTASAFGEALLQHEKPMSKARLEEHNKLVTMAMDLVESIEAPRVPGA